VKTTTTVVGLVIMLALVLATTALAGTGVGADFNLGQLNSSTRYCPPPRSLPWKRTKRNRPVSAGT